MQFKHRHIGPSDSTRQYMLQVIGEADMESLIAKTIPADIRSKGELDVAPGMSDAEYLKHIGDLAARNQVYRSYIGLGYHNTITPPVIRRNILENPGWYTAYTPYQAEISQGRLEALLNFQTMVTDLTGMEMANASLLDEGTAAAEAMAMLYSAMPRAKAKAGVNKFFIDLHAYPQTIEVITTRATAMGVEVVAGRFDEVVLDDTFFGAFIQYPTAGGDIKDYTAFSAQCKANDIKLVCAADIMSLALLTPPGEWGADVVVGSTQRFGVPMGYGGPHAAYFATKEEFKRYLPGRIIGVSKDRHGQIGLRMALQTREQHIRRDKATSNICTAQALLAVMAGMYAVYHGPEGLKAIAQRIHRHTTQVEKGLLSLGFTLTNAHYFDTLTVHMPEAEMTDRLKKAAEKHRMNFWIYPGSAGISLDETTREDDVKDILSVFAEVAGKPTPALDETTDHRLGDAVRTSDYLSHPIFSAYRSETEMMRYMKRLENKDLSLVHSMIPLGSCTMKLNAAAELEPITWVEFADIHPFAPVHQAEGYQIMLKELARDLSVITGFHSVSLQPNSGAQGEYTGLMVIKAYHEDHGDSHRKVVLIPSSAHGTNPASAVMAGYRVQVVACDAHGNVDVDDLRTKAEQYKDVLAGLMVTYPSTHGVFEERIVEINEIIHQNGGLVYMDGANMNAQVGLTSPGHIGADVCHLNLHKTFAIPHGGGGPGMGPIGVVEKLAPYLPTNPIIPTGGEKAISAISSAPFGSALILLISYGYIKMLGPDGLRESTEVAILNANYLKARLEADYDVLYKGVNGTVGHEMILDCRAFKASAKIEVADIAKRLMDYGFHAPTVSFPVGGTMMVEPTESESLAELDRFVEAMQGIREEIREVERGIYSETDNVIKMAPHTALEVVGEWNHSYSREKATYPAEYVKEQKYWPPVSVIDNAHGDRNLICTCPSIESYSDEAEAGEPVLS